MSMSLYRCKSCDAEAVRFVASETPLGGRNHARTSFKHAVKSITCAVGVGRANMDFLTDEEVYAVPAMPKTHMNPVGTTPNTQRVADGIHEVPCSVNPVALLRVTGLATKYLKEHPEEIKGFQDDLNACNRAGEIYNLLWEEVNRKKDNA
jgi:hypothetical protein